jgi:hypothetical protein
MNERDVEGMLIDLQDREAGRNLGAPWVGLGGAILGAIALVGAIVVAIVLAAGFGG